MDELNSIWQQFQQLLGGGSSTNQTAGSIIDPNAYNSAMSVGGGVANSNLLPQTGVDTGRSLLEIIGGGKNADGTSFNGIGSLALGTASGLANGYLGMKQYGLAEDQLEHDREVFNKNYAAQRQMTNTRLEDRQRARVASNPNAYRSVSEYMNQNGVK